MLWSDRTVLLSVKKLALLGLCLISLAACQVRPLYDSSTVSGLSSVVISEGKGDLLNVRNELVFMFYGGGAEPADPVYKLNLGVSSSSQGVVYDTSLGSNIAGRVTVSGTYTLVRISDEKVIGKGSREVTALIDDLDQDFARIRAERNAKLKAGRELAEFIRGDVAIMLSRQAQ